MMNRKPVLYNLASLKRIEPDVIYFVEGKEVALLIEALPDSVDNVAVLGYSKAPDKEYENSGIDNYIKDKIVYIFANNDYLGEKKAELLLEKVKGKARKIYTVRFKDYTKGYGITNFLQEGRPIEEAILLAELEYEKSYEDVDLKNLLIEGVETREFLDRDLNLPRGVLSVVAGYGNVGKGYLMLFMSLKWLKSGNNICYITAEDDIQEIKRRILSLIPKSSFNVETDVRGKLRIYEAINDLLPEILKQQIEESFNIFIIDPLSFFIEEENNVSMNAKLFKELQILCKKHNVNIFVLHHLRKFGLKDAKDKYEMLDAIRGSTSFHNNARFVWLVRRSKENDEILEVFNCKNSYAPNKDFLVVNLFPNKTGNIEVKPLNEIASPVITEKEDINHLPF